MFTDPQQFREYLAVLAEMSPGLRRAGVLHFELGPGKVQLVPVAGDLVPVVGDARPADEDGDDLDDPIAYGRQPGAQVPSTDDFDFSDDEGEQ